MHVRTTENPATFAFPKSGPTLVQRHPQGPGGRPASAKTGNHLFVDTVRFWSTLAIVAIHSATLFDKLHKGSTLLAQSVATPFKFGTIAFFLASGFLLGERLDNCRPGEYLQKRLKKVFLPWLFWFVLLIGFFLTSKVYHHQLTLSFRLDTLGIIGRQAVNCLLMTPFWFVPNLLLSLCVLLLFRKRLNDLRFGAVLLAINLFYVVNIYKLWLPSSHTEAMFGFVFYLWLGTYAARHFGRLSGWIARIPSAAMLGLTLLTAVIALLEARLLGHLRSPDPMNSLRLSNQIFSISVVLMLLKLPRPTWPRFVNVRNNTFGLYLTHTMVLSLVLHTMMHLLARSSKMWLEDSNAGLVCLWVSAVVATYAACLLVTQAIHSQPRLRWLIGSDSAKKQAKTPPRLATVLELPAARNCWEAFPAASRLGAGDHSSRP